MRVLNETLKSLIKTINSEESSVLVNIQANGICVNNIYVDSCFCDSFNFICTGEPMSYINGVLLSFDINGLYEINYNFYDNKYTLIIKSLIIEFCIGL